MKRKILPISILICSLFLKQTFQQQCGAGLYYDEETKKCESCGIKACKVCKKDSSTKKITCESCEDKTFLKENECKDCEKNCLLCDKERCLKCQRSFYPIYQMCRECPDFCISCVFPGKCILCRSGFTANQDTGLCDAPSPFAQYFFRLAVFTFCVFLLFLCFFIPRFMKARKNSQKNYLDKYVGVGNEEEKANEEEEKEEDCLL